MSQRKFLFENEASLAKLYDMKVTRTKGWITNIHKIESYLNVSLSSIKGSIQSSFISKVDSHYAKTFSATDIFHLM